MNLAEIFNIPTSKFDVFIRSVEISSYIPGRARLYSKELINNEPLKEKILNVLNLPELDSIEINVISGSILITYDPATLRKNGELKKVEDYIMTHARRKQ